MFLSKGFIEYSNFEITLVENTHFISATFLILRVFKGFQTNSFDKQLAKQLSKSFENIHLFDPDPNYIETFINSDGLPVRHTWRAIECNSKENLTKAEFMDKIYAAYESCYEKSFVSSVSLPVNA